MYKLKSSICVYCGKIFYHRHKEAKCCSYKCSASYRWKIGNLTAREQTGEKNNSWKGGRIKRICKTCKREFLIFPSVLKYRNSLFCSQECYSRKNKLNPRWRGGITSVGSTIRNSVKYKEWQQQILFRDNFTCQNCKIKGGELHVHHYKKPFSELMEEAKNNIQLFSLYDKAMIYSPLWDINNGQTLCKECHRKTRSYLRHFKRGIL